MSSKVVRNLFAYLTMHNLTFCLEVSLHSSIRRIFWTQTLICALWQSHLCDHANSGHFVFLGDLAKRAITIADIDRFYWNLAICMPFDAALLLRNFVKIVHCQWKLWNCIQRFIFFPDTVYNARSTFHNQDRASNKSREKNIARCIDCSFRSCIFSTSRPMNLKKTVRTNARANAVSP